MRGMQCGVPTADHFAILQTGRDLARRRGITLDEAFRVLAPRATGTKPPLLKQHWWVSGLPGDGDAMPDGWAEGVDGTWSVHAECWARFRVFARALVATNDPGPCPTAPVAWGCSDPEGGCYDDPRALARGLCVLDCGDTRNTFWGRPGQGCELDDELTTAARERCRKLGRCE